MADDLLRQLTVDVECIKINVERNTEDLTKHIEGVVQNRHRIEVIENILSEFKGMKKLLITISICFGLIFSVIQLISLIK